MVLKYILDVWVSRFCLRFGRPKLQILTNILDVGVPRVLTNFSGVWESRFFQYFGCLSSMVLSIICVSDHRVFGKYFGLSETRFLAFDYSNTLGICVSGFCKIFGTSKTRDFDKYYDCLNFEILSQFWASESHGFVQSLRSLKLEILPNILGIWVSR